MHNKLEEIRNKNNKSYLEMSKILGISKTYYWQLEKGKRNLSYKMAYKIAKILKTKPDSLFYDDYKNC